MGGGGWFYVPKVSCIAASMDDKPRFLFLPTRFACCSGLTVVRSFLTFSRFLNPIC
jgi:hypothetical protein